MSEDEACKALEECEDDAAADAYEAEPSPAVEPAIPLVHSFETTVDPLADRMSSRFRAWRASRKRRS